MMLTFMSFLVCRDRIHPVVCVCIRFGPAEAGYYERIDRLVYQLYGLSDEEIRIVEEATYVP